MGRRIRLPRGPSSPPDQPPHLPVHEICGGQAGEYLITPAAMSLNWRPGRAKPTRPYVPPDHFDLGAEPPGPAALV